jgi:hypothetical protein
VARWDLGPKARAPSCRALHKQPALKRLDPVGQSSQPGPGGQVGPTDPVVGDEDPHQAVLHRHLHVDTGRASVLPDVGQSLRADEIHRRLDRGG